MVEYLLLQTYGRQLKKFKDQNNETPMDIAKRKGFIDIELAL
jgi:hypothetical protein